MKDHFVLLFGSETDTRCLVTDQQLIKLLDVRGYWYLDISGDGRPFARCATSRGGGRAFFDGERLMAHPSFQTCAPKVSFFENGYLVNSTQCSIVNGILYPLINEADNVAHTTGAWCGMVDFSLSDAMASFKENDELGAMLKIDREGIIHTPKRSIRPIGVFAPSKVVLDNDGFSVYEWSEFHEL